MAITTDGECAVAGAFQLLLANGPFLSAIGGSGKIFRDTIPAGVTLPAVAVSKSGFKPGTRPQRQGGNYTQIWSRGTVTLSFATQPNYSGNLVRLAKNALDNSAEITVTGLGKVFWFRYEDETDEPVEEGDRVWKLTRVNITAAAKAT